MIVKDYINGLTKNEQDEIINFTNELKKEYCLIEEFFKKENTKPSFMRSGLCLISCPCKKCNPYIL